MTKPKYENIKIANLHLDLKNFRFEEQHSQKEAIATMIADQKDKLVVLAKDIMENGLNPIDQIIVVRMPEGTNQYRVLEGNRRVTCLKLICNPQQVSDEYPKIRRQFQRLASNVERVNQLRRPLCAIFDKEEDAGIWIERKHCGDQNGKGTISWNPFQNSRYDAHNGAKASLTLQAVSFINKMAEEDNSLKDIVENISNTTNIGRLLSDPYVREKLMLKVQDGMLKSFDSMEQTIKKLAKLFVVASQPNFTVNSIRSKKDRKSFIDDFNDHLDDKSLGPLGNGRNLDAPLDSKPSPQQKEEGSLVGEPAPVRPVKSNSKLIADGCSIVIDEPRIAKVFKELGGMLPSTHPNAVAVLLRVFVEQSVDCFIERNGLMPEGKLTSSSTHEPINSKIERCINKLKELGYINADLAKGILYELNDKNSSLSINTMNSFVHNFHFSPKADSLRTGWNNIEPFMTILWKNMPPKQ